MGLISLWGNNSNLLEVFMAIQYELPLFFYDDFDEVEDWSDEEIMGLRSYLLHKTLSILEDGRSCIFVRTESLDWLLDDSIHPFSFRVCCEIEGVNPDLMREGVIGLIKQRQIKG